METILAVLAILLLICSFGSLVLAINLIRRKKVISKEQLILTYKRSIISLIFIVVLYLTYSFFRWLDKGYSISYEFFLIQTLVLLKHFWPAFFAFYFMKRWINSKDSNEN